MKTAYDIELTNNTINVYLNIRTIKSKNISNFALKEKQNTWLKKIDSVWNEQFGLKIDDNIIPVHLIVSFHAPNYHHEVIVKPGSGRSDQLGWRLNSDPSVIAHEIGHMFRLYDEYKGGASEPKNPLIDTTSIMFNDPKKGEVKNDTLNHLEPGSNRRPIEKI